MDDRAAMQSDALLQELMEQISGLYGDALKRLVRKLKRFFQFVEQEEKRPAPDYLAEISEEAVANWHAANVQRAADDERVVEKAAHELGVAGLAASALIYAAMPKVARINRDYTVERAAQVALEHGKMVKLPHKTLEELRVLYSETLPPLSKLAYTNLGNDAAAMKRLRREFQQAIIRRELPRDMIARIRRVTGMSYSDAQRVAQTEGNRIMSEARYNACQEAAENGIVYINEWSARMVRTRESHAALDRTKKRQGETFRTIWGNELRFPGDPTAPAREVINCHCVLLPCDSIEEG